MTSNGSFDCDKETQIGLTTTLHALVKGLGRQGNNPKRQRILLERALKIEQRVLGGVHVSVAATLLKIAKTFRTLAQVETKEEYLHKAIRVYEQLFGKQSTQLSGAMVELALCRACQRDHSGAHILLQNCVDIEMSFSGIGSPATLKLQKYFSNLRQIQQALPEIHEHSHSIIQVETATNGVPHDRPAREWRLPNSQSSELVSVKRQEISPPHAPSEPFPQQLQILQHPHPQPQPLTPPSLPFPVLDDHDSHLIASTPLARESIV
eukprot:m.121090 g.121090  ORF g.121090 m.121090 type:complete len:265 (+) comp28844_c0_seq16:3162-3956(+)